MENNTFPEDKIVKFDDNLYDIPSNVSDFQNDTITATISDILDSPSTSTFLENETAKLTDISNSSTSDFFTDEIFDTFNTQNSTFTTEAIDILNQQNSSFSMSDDIMEDGNSTLTTILDQVNSTFTAIISNQTSKPTEVPFYLNFRDEPWVVPLIAFAFINVIVILIFEIYVLYRSCGGRRHLFLGQILLMGLLLSSLLALVYVLQPHWLLCGITRAGLGIVYAIIFGTLLVKCVFLLKIHSGMYINASLQGLLLFFIVSTEIAIVTMWLHYEPPIVSQSFLSTIPSCTKTVLERVSYLSYNMFLLFVVIVMSIRTRSLRENNREALYIGISIAITLVLWVAWISVLVIFGRSFEAPAEAFGLVSISLVIFFLIFIPKAVHLARSRKQEKQASNSHSVLHTPSFLRLQPQAVLPSSTHGTLMKQSSNANNGNADYLRGYDARVWRYDYPSFRRQSNPPAIVHSDYNSLKKNGSAYSNPDY